jgi:ribonuclease HII
MENRFQKELDLIKQGYDFIIGVDEVGRGPLAGPVVAAAVVFSEELENIWWKEIFDSKKLSEAKREYLFSVISEHAKCSVGVASVMEIEQLNILQASLLAMKRAVENFSNIDRAVILVDGKFIIPGIVSKQEAIVKGDSIVHSIAASSIIAKVTRDRMMRDFDLQYPEYNFAQHKGYGTRQHINAIKEFGLSPIHRASFCGNILTKEN